MTKRTQQSSGKEWGSLITSTPKITDYIYTRSGKVIYLEKLEPHQIALTDISFGLSNIYRFNGQTNISVLTHSLALALSLDRKFELYALLHDAAEAYMMNVPVPLKRFMTKRWHALYGRVEEMILTKFNCSVNNEVRFWVQHHDKAVVEYEMGASPSARMRFPGERSLSKAARKRFQILYNIPDARALWERRVRELSGVSD